MLSVLFDTSVYIAAFRRGDLSILDLRRSATDSPLWLSAVVLEELYAGANDGSRAVIEGLRGDFERIRRILTPDSNDWAQAGILLGRVAARYGYEENGRGRLTNDALIAVSAERVGMGVMTINAKDFGRLAEFCPFEWQRIEI